MNTEEKRIFEEYKKRPLLTQAINASWLLLFGGVIVNTFFADKFTSMHILYISVGVMHLVGAISAGAAMLFAPDSLKTLIRKRFCFVAIANMVMFMMSGYRYFA